MNMHQLAALAPIIVISVTAVAVMLLIAVRRSLALTGIVAGCGIILALAAVAIAWQPNPVQATLLIRVDRLTLLATGLLLLAGLTVMGFCYDYFKTRQGENEELLLLLLTAMLGASVLVSSSHFAAFFMGLETLSISLFVLIGYTVNRPRPLEAAIKYLVLSGVSSALLLMGMALIYAQSGVLHFSGIGQFISSQREIDIMTLSGIVLLTAALGFKLSLVPFHLWTPDVYEGASSPVTAFIATVSKAAVMLLLLRFLLDSGSFQYAPLLTVLSVIAVLSILAGNLLALLQNNVKRLLAYSSIAHMGYLLVALIAAAGIAPALAVESVTFYLVAYFITTLGAFGVVSVISTPQAEACDVTCYRGLFWQRPWLAAVFTLMLLSLAGIPLTAGFIAKFYIFTSGADGQLWGLLAAVIVGSGLGLYYYLRVIVQMTLTADGADSATEPANGQWLSAAALATLTVLLVWLGIYPEQLMHFIRAVSMTGS